VMAEIVIASGCRSHVAISSATEPVATTSPPATQM
jgi:hypothetical protein